MDFSILKQNWEVFYLSIAGFVILVALIRVYLLLNNSEVELSDEHKNNFENHNELGVDIILKHLVSEREERIEDLKKLESRFEQLEQLIISRSDTTRSNYTERIFDTLMAINGINSTLEKYKTIISALEPVSKMIDERSSESHHDKSQELSLDNLRKLKRDFDKVS